MEDRAECNAETLRLPRLRSIRSITKLPWLSGQRPFISYLSTGFSKTSSECVVGNAESAGINRHVVGDEKALQERRAANPSWPRVLQATSRGIDEIREKNRVFFGDGLGATGTTVNGASHDREKECCRRHENFPEGTAWDFHGHRSAWLGSRHTGGSGPLTSRLGSRTRSGSGRRCYGRRRNG